MRKNGNTKIRKRENMTSKQLLERLMDLFDAKNESDLCEKSGIGRSTLGSWKRRDSLPKLSVIIDIADRTGVSLDYLVLGRDRQPTTYDPDTPTEDSRGLPAITSVKEVMAAIKAQSAGGLDTGFLEETVAAVVRAETELHTRMAALREYLSDASALAATQFVDPQPVDVVELAFVDGGEAEALTEEVTGRLWFRQAWLNEYGLDASRCAVIGVKGDSMEPTVMEGAKILIDRMRSDWRAGDIFAIHAPNGLLVRRAGADTDGKALMLSDNPSWETEAWPDDAQILGRVIWTAKTLVTE